MEQIMELPEQLLLDKFKELAFENYWLKFKMEQKNQMQKQPREKEDKQQGEYVSAERFKECLDRIDQLEKQAKQRPQEEKGQNDRLLQQQNLMQTEQTEFRAKTDELSAKFGQLEATHKEILGRIGQLEKQAKPQQQEEKGQSSCSLQQQHQSDMQTEFCAKNIELSAKFGQLEAAHEQFVSKIDEKINANIRLIINPIQTKVSELEEQQKKLANCDDILKDRCEIVQQFLQSKNVCSEQQKRDKLALQMDSLSNLVNGTQIKTTTPLEDQRREKGQNKNQNCALSESGIFIAALKDLFGNELLNAVHPSLRLEICEKFSKQQPNGWDATACDGDLEITGDECSTVTYAGYDLIGVRSVFAKNSIPGNGSGIFYFEMKIVNVNFNDAKIGISTKFQSVSFKYDSKGYFWINSCQKKAKEGFGSGDIVGCGINLTTRRIFFTKNGHRLDGIGMFLPQSQCSSAVRLFPCVSLWHSGDKIEANFGPHFKFNPAILLSNSHRNCWESSASHNGLEIADDECLVVHHKGSEKVWRSVFAKCSVPRDDFGISYFEILVVNLKNNALIGFTTKHKTDLDKMIIKRCGTFAYQSDGTFWVNGAKKIGHSSAKFSAGDIVGCGINSFTRQILFTKNGQRMDSVNLFISPPSDPLFSFVSLYDFGDKIKANFCSNFSFDLTTF